MKIELILLLFIGLDKPNLKPFVDKETTFNLEQVNHMRITCHEKTKIVYKDKQVLIESFPNHFLKDTDKGLVLSKSIAPLPNNIFRIKMKGIVSVSVYAKGLSGVISYEYFVNHGKEVYVYVSPFYEPSDTFFDVCTKETMFRISLDGKMVNE